MKGRIPSTSNAERRKLALMRHATTNATTRTNIGGVEKRATRAGAKTVTLPKVNLKDIPE